MPKGDISKPSSRFNKIANEDYEVKKSEEKKEEILREEKRKKKEINIIINT